MKPFEFKPLISNILRACRRYLCAGISLALVIGHSVAGPPTPTAIWSEAKSNADRLRLLLPVGQRLADVVPLVYPEKLTSALNAADRGPLDADVLERFESAWKRAISDLDHVTWL